MRRLSGLWLLLMTLAVPAAAQLPDDLAGYERWKVLRAGDLPTEGPHPGTKTVYVNDHGPGGEGRLRPRPYRVEEYLRARPSEPFRLAFGGPSGQALCVACHLGARDADFVYSLKR